jgi:2'-5' RNA ligase
VATGPVAPVVWQADGFVLIHSLFGQTRHVVLGHWSFGGDGGN